MSKRKRGKEEAKPVLNIKFARQDQAARQDELRKDMPAWTSDKEALKLIYNEVIRYRSLTQGSRQKQADFVASWRSFESHEVVGVNAFFHKDTGERCFYVFLGPTPGQSTWACRLYDDSSVYTLDGRAGMNRFYEPGTPLL